MGTQDLDRQDMGWEEKQEERGEVLEAESGTDGRSPDIQSILSLLFLQYQT